MCTFQLLLNGMRYGMRYGMGVSKCHGMGKCICPCCYTCQRVGVIKRGDSRKSHRH